MLHDKQWTRKWFVNALWFVVIISDSWIQVRLWAAIILVPAPSILQSHTCAWTTTKSAQEASSFCQEDWPKIMYTIDLRLSFHSDSGSPMFMLSVWRRILFRNRNSYYWDIVIHCHESEQILHQCVLFNTAPHRPFITILRNWTWWRSTTLEHSDVLSERHRASVAEGYKTNTQIKYLSCCSAMTRSWFRVLRFQ